MSSNKIAPIVLFVYNRPWHTRQTVEALQKNEFANYSELFVFSDSAKNEDAAFDVDKVRNYLRSISGFKQVTVIEREVNYGLSQNIIEGVTEICNRYGRVIVLEDDLVTSPFFLQFMNDALEIYQDQEDVMSITGYTFPIDNTKLKQTFFLKILGCWGWATWDRAWQHFEKNSKYLVNNFTKDDIHRFNLESSFDFWSQVKLNESGAINTWAIFWYASMFLKNGLSLFPSISMVKNIGNDGTGVHCGKTDIFYTELGNTQITYFETNVIENITARDRTSKFLLNTKPSFLSSCYNFLKRFFSKVKIFIGS
jgi:hypothetical protein